MSWGIKITLLYSGFVILIVSMVFISVNSKSELVAADYYAQELKYQEKIDAMANEKRLTASITHEVNASKVTINYPNGTYSKDFEGTILFFRPSDSKKDLKVEMSIDPQWKQTIDRSKLAKGIYKMCLSWKNNNIQYYKEEVITI